MDFVSIFQVLTASEPKEYYWVSSTRSKAGSVAKLESVWKKIILTSTVTIAPIVLYYCATRSFQDQFCMASSLDWSWNDLVPQEYKTIGAMLTVDAGIIFFHTDFTLCRTPNKLLMAEKMLLTSLKPKNSGDTFLVYVTFSLIGGWLGHFRASITVEKLFSKCNKIRYTWYRAVYYYIANQKLF